MCYVNCNIIGVVESSQCVNISQELDCTKLNSFIYNTNWDGLEL